VLQRMAVFYQNEEKSSRGVPLEKGHAGKENTGEYGIVQKQD